jgi:hypothetical protein
VAQFSADMEVITCAHVHVQELNFLTCCLCMRSSIKHVDPCTGSLASPPCAVALLIGRALLPCLSPDCAPARAGEPASREGAGLSARLPQAGPPGPMAGISACGMLWLRATSGPFHSNSKSWLQCPERCLMNNREAMAETTITTARILGCHNSTEDCPHKTRGIRTFGRSKEKVSSARARAWGQPIPRPSRLGLARSHTRICAMVWSSRAI